MATGNDDQFLKPSPGLINAELKVSFSKLKKISNTTLHSDAVAIAWKAVQDTVALRLMGERGCAVPYLHEATKYGLFNILVKEKQNVVDKVVRRPSCIHWSAPLEDILPPHMKIEDFRSSNRAVLVEEDSNALIHYHLKNKDQSKGSTLVDVDLKMTNVQHYKIESDYQETAVDINKHFTGKDKIERIYLITEVFTASTVVMDVKVGENTFQWNNPSMMPVGFVFRKCEMTEGGILKFGPEVDRQKAIGYNWLPSDEKSDKVDNATREKLVKSPSASMVQ